jgi:hypothetical protein
MFKVHDNFALWFTADKVHSAQVRDTPKMEGWTQLWPHPGPHILRMHGLVLGPFVNAPGIQRLYPILVAFNAVDSGTWSVDEDDCVLRLRPAGVPLCGPTRTHARTQRRRRRRRLSRLLLREDRRTCLVPIATSWFILCVAVVILICSFGFSHSPSVRFTKMSNLRVCRVDSNSISLVSR